MKTTIETQIQCECGRLLKEVERGVSEHGVLIIRYEHCARCAKLSEDTGRLELLEELNIPDDEKVIASLATHVGNEKKYTERDKREAAASDKADAERDDRGMTKKD